MVRQDRLDCALALITHGAEIDAKDNEVRTMIDKLVSYSYFTLELFLTHEIPIISILGKHGAPHCCL